MRYSSRETLQRAIVTGSPKRLRPDEFALLEEKEESFLSPHVALCGDLTALRIIQRRTTQRDGIVRGGCAEVTGA